VGTFLFTSHHLPHLHITYLTSYTLGLPVTYLVYTGLFEELEYLTIETRLIDEKFAICVFSSRPPQILFVLLVFSPSFLLHKFTNWGDPPKKNLKMVFPNPFFFPLLKETYLYSLTPRESDVLSYAKRVRRRIARSTSIQARHSMR